MKAFDVLTRFESDTEYRFDGVRMTVELGDTVGLDAPIYRAMYATERTRLDTAIYLKGLSNVTLDFGGATLYLRDDSIQPFVLDECTNVTVKNVIVEYERSMMDEMDLVEVGDGELVFLQTEQQKLHFPMRVENGDLIPLAHGKEYRGALREPMFLSFHDRKSGTPTVTRLVRIGKDLPTLSWESYPFKYYDLVAEARGEFVVLRGAFSSSLTAGLTASICHASRELTSCSILRSKNVRLENFRVLNGAGMGILGMYSETVTLDRLQFFFDERSHGFATNAADAVHLISCFGRVEIVNSIFEGMKDDALNIHGNYYTVDRVADGVIYAKLGTGVQAHPGVTAHYKMFDAGDLLSICRGSTTLEKKTLTVTRVEVTGDFSATIHVSGDTAGILQGDSIENLSAQADLHVKNCRFGKARTHLRLQTRGKILMEDCDCELAVCLTGDKNYWFEGSPVRDLTVQNCRFLGERGYVSATPSFDVCEESPYYHCGIRVIGNTFDTTRALQLSHCRDVLFQKNVNAAALPFENQFEGCENVVTQ